MFLRFLTKLGRWGRRGEHLLWYLEFSLEGKECGVWEIPSGGSKSMLAIWKNVICIGQQSLPSGLVAIHWFEPSQWTKMALEDQFLCYGYHKQLRFRSRYSILFPFISNYFLLVINNFLFGRFIEMDHMKLFLVHHFFCINQSGWFHFINSRRSFLIPNTKMWE